MKYIKLNNEIKEELKEVIKTDPRYRSRMRAQAFLLNSEGVKIPGIQVKNLKKKLMNGKNLDYIYYIFIQNMLNLFG